MKISNLSQLGKKHLLRSFLYPFLGKTWSQSFFSKLFRLSLKGLHIGNGAELKLSGEVGVLDNFIIEWLRRKHQRPFILFDVGANNGEYTRSALELFERNKCQAKVFSFEPIEEIYVSLEKNIGNDVRVLCLRQAIGSRNEIVSMYTNSEVGALSSFYELNIELVGKEVVMQQVEQITLDTFCGERGLEQIDFLKMDIEGYELEALHGANNLIASGRVSAIQFEFGKANIAARIFFRDYFELLHKDYKIYRILKNGICEVPYYDETLEQFSITNFLAIHRKIQK